MKIVFTCSSDISLNDWHDDDTQGERKLYRE